MPVSSPRFFVAGGTLRSDAACYVTRHADQQLYDALVNGEFAYVLTSRQMGKSSLMVRTARKLRMNGFLVAVVDLTALGQNVTATQWYFTLAERIALQLGIDEQRMERSRIDVARSPLQNWIRFIEQIVSASDLPIVIFIDEVDLIRSLPFATDEFFAAIRQFFNRRSEETQFERLSFCLLGVAAPSDLIRDPQMTPFNIGTRIELSDFSREEAALLAAGLGTGRSAQSSLNRVMHWTAGHPYLVQRLCQAISSSSGRSDVDAICADVFLAHRVREQDDNLLFVRERILNTQADLASLLTLYSRVLRGQRVRDDDTNPLVTELKLSGICKAVTGNLRVRNPIYSRVFDRRWISDSMPGAEIRRQRTAFRRGVLFTALTASVVIAVIAGLGFTVLRQRDENQRQLYVSDITLAQLAWAHHMPSQARELLGRHLPKRGQRDLRGFEWYMLWNLSAARRPLAQIDVGEIVRTAAPSPDGKRVFASTIKNELIIFDATDGARLRTATLEGGYNAISVSPDGRLLATASSSGRLTLWNADTLATIASIETPDVFRAISFSSHGKWLISTSEFSARVWRIPDLFQTADHTIGDDEMRQAEFSPDGRMVALATRNHLEVWSSDLSHLKGRFAANQPGLISFCPDSGCIAVGNYGSVDIITLGTKQIRSLKGDWGFNAGLAFFPDGHRIVSSGSDGTVRIWELATERPIDMFVPEPSAGNTYLFAGGRILSAGASRYITIWDADHFTPDLSSGDEIYTLAFLPNKNELISAGNDEKLRIWDVASRSLLQTINVGERINYVGVLNSSQAVVGSTHHVSLWDFTKATRLVNLAVSPGYLTAELSPDGRAVATADTTAGEMRLLFTTTGQVLARHRLMTVPHAIAFSPDGKVVAVSGTGNRVFIWRGDEESRQLNACPLSSNALRFSPDGKYLLEGCDGSGDIYVLDWKNGATKMILHGHRQSIKSLRYSPDGSRLVSTSDDGSLRIWDAVTLESLIATDESELSVEASAFSPDGRFLAAAGDDHRIRLWNGPGTTK